MERLLSLLLALDLAWTAAEVLEHGGRVDDAQVSGVWSGGVGSGSYPGSSL